MYDQDSICFAYKPSARFGCNQKLHYKVFIFAFHCLLHYFENFLTLPSIDLMESIALFENSMLHNLSAQEMLALANAYSCSSLTMVLKRPEICSLSFEPKYSLHTVPPIMKNGACIVISLLE